MTAKYAADYFDTLSITFYVSVRQFEVIPLATYFEIYVLFSIWGEIPTVSFCLVILYNRCMVDDYTPFSGLDDERVCKKSQLQNIHNCSYGRYLCEER